MPAPVDRLEMFTLRICHEIWKATDNHVQKGQVSKEHIGVVISANSKKFAGKVHLPIINWGR